jgi:tRNA uridine 5-carboxymethylaminomethyl modification enzyme
MNPLLYDVIVVGGGHAGAEASSAAARLGLKTALLTMDRFAIGRMSCNPAIGGVGKGQIVRDIDALGGIMGIISDQAGIQFRMLNSSKGPAVWGPRAQQDMALYSELVRTNLESTVNLDILEGTLNFLEKQGEKWGLKDDQDREFLSKAVIITSGTFLRGLMHTGESQSTGGRVGEKSAEVLSASLFKLNLKLWRLKTGTPSRLEASSIDYSAVEEQPGDSVIYPFSYRSKKPPQNHASCWLTRTTAHTHDILRTGFNRSPLFKGVIQGLGPRYCPSIEDKVNRFPERLSHHLFLEPEGLNSNRIYVNGFSSSLPAEIQEAALRSIPGLEKCNILQIGYAVEYDAIDANQLYSTMECRANPGLYFAGQVNGTSGYEEAAGQGLIAGINAAHKILGRAAYVPGRADSYIGVMLDDLVHMKIDEPYRMFTSRAEYRLFLRYDNAATRLMSKGFEIGLIDRDTFQKFSDSNKKIYSIHKQLSDYLLRKEVANPLLEKTSSKPLEESVRAIGLLKRPGIELEPLLKICEIENNLDWVETLQLQAEELYEGFYKRQSQEIDRQRRMEGLKIPFDFDFLKAEAVSIEARQKLNAARPLNLGEAKGIAGVRPADISALIYYLDKG